MQVSSLQEQKKELKQLEASELVELCMRLGRYKKDNKELLNYLLFHQQDPAAYTEHIKNYLQADFKNLNMHSYYTVKSLRKILRVIGRQAKYLNFPQFEIELLLWFCTNYLEKVDLRSNNKVLQNIFLRQTEKIGKLMAKLHEDLQHDYRNEIDKIHNLASQKCKWYKSQPGDL